jgi:hypothetical protein
MSARGGYRRRHVLQALDAEQVLQVFSQRAEGMGFKEIAFNFGVSRGTIFRAFHGLGPYAAHKSNPHAWAIQGCSRMWKGEYAEIDSKNEARRCGGSCYAYPLFTR